jgi:hypothetical protein
MGEASRSCPWGCVHQRDPARLDRSRRVRAVFIDCDACTPGLDISVFDLRGGVVTVYYSDDTVTLHLGHVAAVLPTLEAVSVDCVVTSPPYYGLRDYGVDGQIGLEASPAEYVETMRAVFAEVRRVLADDGVLWLNLGDSYSGGSRASYDPPGHLTGGVPLSRPINPAPAKNLLGVPWRVAFALQDDGWILRNAVIWNKPNAMPESVTDRLSCLVRPRPDPGAAGLSGRGGRVTCVRRCGQGRQPGAG